LERNIDREAPELHKENVKIQHIGRLEELSQSLQLAINRAMYLTKDNTGMSFIIALNCGSRLEILDAARRILDAGILPNNIDETVV
jgi:undecaprenyl diphosphate synthase